MYHPCINSRNHGKAIPHGPGLPPIDLPRENDGWFDQEAQLQAEAREREVEDGLGDYELRRLTSVSQ
jgi:hypothetical protein